MAGLSLDHPGAFIFGILGNIISFMVYLAPLPTFCRVYRNRSTEGFQSIPYVVALFSATLWIYYAVVKSIADNILLITINAVGCFIETLYIIIYLIYAPNTARASTCKIIFLLNVLMFGLVVLVSQAFSKGDNRIIVLGWVCVGFSICVFIAPLSIIRLVISTRSVEFMPLSLSASLTVSAILWFFYGLATKDKFVALPNVLGFAFGVIQMALYFYYKNSRPTVVVVEQMEHVVDIAIPRPSAAAAAEVHPIDQNVGVVVEMANGPREDKLLQEVPDGEQRRCDPN